MHCLALALSFLSWALSLSIICQALALLFALVGLVPLFTRPWTCDLLYKPMAPRDLSSAFFVRTLYGAMFWQALAMGLALLCYTLASSLTFLAQPHPFFAMPQNWSLISKPLFCPCIVRVLAMVLLCQALALSQPRGYGLTRGGTPIYDSANKRVAEIGEPRHTLVLFSQGFSIKTCIYRQKRNKQNPNSNPTGTKKNPNPIRKIKSPFT